MGAHRTKIPKRYYPYSGELDSFVLAAHTEALSPACNVLLVHAGDLSWAQGSGSFLYRIDLGDDVMDAIEMTEARTKMGGVALARSFWPFIQSLMAEMAGKYGEMMDPEKDDEWHQALAALVGASASKRVDIRSSKLAGVNLQDIIPLLIDGLSSWLAKRAIALRKRQLASLGMSENEYDYMVRCLERIGSECTAIARVAFPGDSLHPELGLSGNAGFRVTELDANAHVVEILRLGRVLDRLKRGEDKALPIFIATLVNRHLPFEQVAYACARYGEKDQAEYDVVIPKLSVGMEIKVYQGRGVMTPDRILTAARDLSKQLKHYIDFGFQRVIYVANLEQAIAREVLDKALRGIDKPKDVKVEAVGGGIQDIINFSKNLSDEIGEMARDASMKMVRAAYERNRGQTGHAGQANALETHDEDAAAAAAAVERVDDESAVSNEGDSSQLTENSENSKNATGRQSASESTVVTANLDEEESGTYGHLTLPEHRHQYGENTGTTPTQPAVQNDKN